MVWTRQEFSAKVKDGLKQKHPWKNSFHLEMPFGLINDPNGLSFYEGEYQLFFQWNPYSCEHKQKHWGHVSTKDFVHYKEPILAMGPDSKFDKDGCYTGCAFVENEVLQIVYTGNVRNELQERESYQCLGILQEDGTIKKDKVLIERQPAGYTAHFRDPYAFFRDGKKYMVLGAQNKELQGRLLIYGEEKESWHFIGEVQTELRDFGYMWECPNLLRFGKVDVLLFSPQGLLAERYKNQNLYETGYVMGELDAEKAVLHHGDFIELDHGFDFYAPQVMEHDGRKILIGWMGMPDRDEEYPTAAEGWMFSLTMPRELILKDGKIHQQPVHELEKLRGEFCFAFTGCVRNWSYILPRRSEIDLKIQLDDVEQIKYTLFFGSEQIVFAYERELQSMTIDRSGMKLGGQGSRRFRLDCGEVLEVRLFIDQSAIECFFQQGEEAASFLYFPQKESIPEISVQADTPWKSLDCTVWELDGLVYDTRIEK